MSATEPTDAIPAPGDALVIVDVQEDFVRGSLAVPGGEEVIPPLNRAAEVFAERGLPVFATRDWHPEDHVSFEEQGGPWPPHCVQGTPGAELHRSLPRDAVDVVVDAGYEPHLEGYSGFEGTPLAGLLRERGVDHVTVVGLATDYCGKNTALDAVREGFSVTVDSTATRGVDVEPGDSERALEQVRAAGASVA